MTWAATSGNGVRTGITWITAARRPTAAPGVAPGHESGDPWWRMEDHRAGCARLSVRAPIRPPSSAISVPGGAAAFCSPDSDICAFLDGNSTHRTLSHPCDSNDDKRIALDRNVKLQRGVEMRRHMADAANPIPITM